MNGLFRALQKQHRRQEALLETLIRDAHAGDATLAEIAWEALQRAVSEHMDAEELHLLSIFDLHDPEEAHALWAEHQEIRALLAEVGVGLAVGLLSVEKINELAGLLWRHTEREESRLYLWADCMLNGPQAIAVLEHLGEGIRARLAIVPALVFEERSP